jgi:predicted PurR-regulated permease PerM
MMQALDRPLNNQRGSMMAVVMMILALLTIFGMLAIATSNTELETATSEQIYKLAFFAADTGIAYVEQNPDLYHDQNLTVGGSLSFPDTADNAVEYNLGSLQSFNGTVGYIGSSAPPRGSGYEAGNYSAHNYQIISDGFGPRNSAIQIEAGFYRIGF